MAVPRSAPKSTSVGKCTNRYSLENAISAASKSAHSPHFLLYRKILTADSKLASVCPEGNEKSLGLWISSVTAGSNQHGLCLATTGLRNPWPMIRPTAMDSPMASPILRVFFPHKSKTASRIQNQPLSPRNVIHVINSSKNGVCSFWSIYSLSLIHISAEFTNKKIAVRKADQIYLLVDSSKFGASTLMTYCPLSEIDCIVTDKLPEPSICEAVEAAGNSIVLCENQ